jgi:hypothetical protein
MEFIEPNISPQDGTMPSQNRREYRGVVADICRLRWASVTAADLTDAAWAYYYFSVQFRENLEIAAALHPGDRQIRQLKAEECDTANLSPWPGVANVGERLNHDEFMRRLLELETIAGARQQKLTKKGKEYLKRVREFSDLTRAASIDSYEDGGLERVFRAMLQARHWDGLVLQAFRHFLTEHIKFDSDPLQGHGSLTRHLSPNDQVDGLWIAFQRLLIEAVPKLAS